MSEIEFGTSFCMQSKCFFARLQSLNYSDQLVHLDPYCLRLCLAEPFAEVMVEMESGTFCKHHIFSPGCLMASPHLPVAFFMQTKVVRSFNNGSPSGIWVAGKCLCSDLINQLTKQWKVRCFIKSKWVDCLQEMHRLCRCRTFDWSVVLWICSIAAASKLWLIVILLHFFDWAFTGMLGCLLLYLQMHFIWCKLFWELYGSL